MTGTETLILAVITVLITAGYVASLLIGFLLGHWWHNK